MAAVPIHWKTAAAAAALVLAGLPAGAQGTAFKCVSNGQVTYSQIPCPGGRQVGPPPVRVSEKHKDPPQDRAVAARRARLTPQERGECRALDATLVEQERFVKTRGDAATLEDEMPLVQSKKRFRELKC